MISLKQMNKQTEKQNNCNIGLHFYIYEWISES